MNKLVKGNLVRGLPSKLFENDQTCVACQKGKQHRASCKSKTENSISLPLHLLHMDLFGPTFVKSLMKKMYCLVVTDDYSRFTWVFFLATKDETSGILKSFITGIENLVDHKVKVIRCDNGTEFKNREMNQFCEMKGILRQFSVARTPQQNRVAERRNMTLIEAARTMLADSKLPTTFWAEAVNTACYVQNRVLVVKPHNKTPYELFYGRTPTLSFMRPFRNKVSGENLNIRFNESTPNVVGTPGLMVCKLKASNNAGSARKETRTCQDLHFALPYGLLIHHIPVFQRVLMIDGYTFKYGAYLNSQLGDVKVDAMCSGGHEQSRLNNPRTQKGNSCIEGSKLDRGYAGRAYTIKGYKKFRLLGRLPNGKRAIGTKWVFRNKKDEKEIVIRNKARLVAQGYIQEEGIDYDEVSAPVARIKAIRLFLSYASFKDFVVYQMDVKSVFLYGKIEEEVYVCKPPGFEDPDFPDRVYKGKKAYVMLHSSS
ncbi:putative ribonuclease H-like domain-containing protein [Tanacetum coccineum]|uniref:Ribonuclease H-like domain-containing protein n=1 Tax=Tanacetum coccineum TaxID=301880 RepID=A0ABQ4Z9W5_9ASTR